MKVCPHCGFHNMVYETVCFRCGKHFDGERETEAEENAAAPQPTEQDDPFPHMDIDALPPLQKAASAFGRVASEAKRVLCSPLMLLSCFVCTLLFLLSAAQTALLVQQWQLAQLRFYAVCGIWALLSVFGLCMTVALWWAYANARSKRTDQVRRGGLRFLCGVLPLVALLIAAVAALLVGGYFPLLCDPFASAQSFFSFARIALTVVTLVISFAAVLSVKMAAGRWKTVLKTEQAPKLLSRAPIVLSLLAVVLIAVCGYWWTLAFESFEIRALTAAAVALMLLLVAFLSCLLLRCRRMMKALSVVKDDTAAS